jgi:ribosomal protein L44E
MFKPRQKPVVIEKKKPIRRKCFNCGKMKTNPYIFTVVPSISMYDNKIPLYNKNVTHTNRIDLKDKKDQLGIVNKKKVDISYYCDTECHKEHSKTQVESYDI